MKFELALMTIEFIALLLCAFFFSASETAITAITRAEYKAIKKSRTKKSKTLAFLIEKKDEIVSATLIGTNFVNTLSSALITAFVIDMYGQQHIPAATAVTTVLIIIFAEILPKAIAAYNAVEITKTFLIPLSIVRLFFKPIVFIFSLMSNFIIKSVSKRRENQISDLSEDYLETLINISLADGTFQTGEHELIKRAVRLHELKLQSIMTKKEDIVGFDINSTPEKMISIFRKTMFSRLPVYKTEKDKIIGSVHYKDLLFYKSHKAEMDINKIIRPALFIPKTANIFSAIKTMSKNKRNMAFVIDEYGSTAGLITIDDISTAIFGSIQDEYAKIKTNPLSGMKIVDGTHILIPGSVPIIQLNKILNTDFHSDYNDTIGGLVLETAEYLPKEGEFINIGDIEFKVEKVETSKIIFLIADVSKITAGAQFPKAFQ
ncbi:HlyC/CorC family transporter [Treponema sp. OMZ 792]|uniref:hemolysin family protein n=1 Tax=unclassified Treponema TaxID=2638727 RepID=UPI0020A24A5C|nr:MULTISPECIES: hemolysin family protein [unclassified Treponema]UTC74873.1 HlyC/CorC family transporter [Treponema sp. OMZ 792]UTC76784.1 HlyC/CorC family transporter [Treponema sp. OMZ 799]UTC81266.1 HlyC/CorC family transporter [Treponema sp. OMZ 798]